MIIPSYSMKVSEAHVICWNAVRTGTQNHTHLAGYQAENARSKPLDSVGVVTPCDRRIVPRGKGEASVVNV